MDLTGGPQPPQCNPSQNAVDPTGSDCHPPQCDPPQDSDGVVLTGGPQAPQYNPPQDAVDPTGSDCHPPQCDPPQDSDGVVLTGPQAPQYNPTQDAVDPTGSNRHPPQCDPPQDSDGVVLTGPQAPQYNPPQDAVDPTGSDCHPPQCDPPQDSDGVVLTGPQAPQYNPPQDAVDPTGSDCHPPQCDPPQDSDGVDLTGGPQPPQYNQSQNAVDPSGSDHHHPQCDPPQDSNGVVLTGGPQAPQCNPPQDAVDPTGSDRHPPQCDPPQDSDGVDLTGGPQAPQCNPPQNAVDLIGSDRQPPHYNPPQDSMDRTVRNPPPPVCDPPPGSEKPTGDNPQPPDYVTISNSSNNVSGQVKQRKISTMFFSKPRTKTNIQSDCSVDQNHHDIVNITQAGDGPPQMAGMGHCQPEPPVPSGLRNIKSKWFVDFSWLSYDQTKCQFFCKLCVEFKRENIFTKGRSAVIPKRDDFVKHEMSKDHAFALRSKDERSKMAVAMQKAADQMQLSVEAVMRTILCMCKTDIALCKVSTIVELQIANGSPSLSKLERPGAPSYTHHESVNDMVVAMESVVMEQLMMRIHASNFYSIEADEATDVSNKSVLVVFIRFVPTESPLKPETHFLGARELEATNADSIVRVIKSILCEKNLPLSNMVGIATDGASVMTGCRIGVVTQFKKECPFLVANHCLAHRLQLVTEKAATCVPDINKYIGTLNCFAKALKFSPKLTRALETSKTVNGVTANKIKQVFFTRWLSFSDSVQALVQCLPEVMSAIFAAAPERADKALLFGILDQMNCYSFVHLTAFLADAIGLVGILSRAIQVKNPVYHDVKEQVQSCVVAITALQHMKGPYLAQLATAFPTNPPPSGVTLYGGHEIKDTLTERRKFEESSALFIDNVTTRLATLFPDGHIQEAFETLFTQHADEKKNQPAFEVLWGGKMPHRNNIPGNHWQDWGQTWVVYHPKPHRKLQHTGENGWFPTTEQCCLPKFV